jgi:hypothetical protein
MELCMFPQISFQNYRPFERGRVALRPLTVLLGANNVGKTSIIQLFLLLQQTAIVTDSKYKSALKLHGKIVSMGDPQNLFHNRQVDKPLEISITYTNEPLLRDLQSGYLAEFQFYLVNVLRANTTSHFTDLVRPVRQRLMNYYDVNWDDLSGAIESIEQAQDSIDQFPGADSPAVRLPIFLDPSLYSDQFAPRATLLSKDQLGMILSLLRAFKDVKSASFTVVFELNYRDDDQLIGISEISLRNGPVVLISVESRFKRRYALSA